MSRRLTPPPRLRLPMAFSLLSAAFVIVLLSLQRSLLADGNSEQARLSQAIAQAEKTLSSREERQNLYQRAESLLADLRHTIPVPPMSQARAANGSIWREHIQESQFAVAHEEVLLAHLAEWRGRSPIQHQLRACHIARDDEGLLARCRLSLLEWME